MNRKTPQDHNYTASKPSLPRSETIGKIGSDPVSLKNRRNVSEDMAVTESITIDLAEIGAAVPDGATVDVRPTARGLAIDRRERRSSSSVTATASR